MMGIMSNKDQKGKDLGKFEKIKVTSSKEKKYPLEIVENKVETTMLL